MKTASISEAKKNLSALIESLEAGPVLILNRGRPVARLEPVNVADYDRLASLIRKGLVTPARLPPDPSLFKEPPPRISKLSALQALLDEREEGW
jgi:prevent-host-death family protein